MKYKKKPVVIEAVKWDGSAESTREIYELVNGKVEVDAISQKKFYDYYDTVRDSGIAIYTLEGTMIVQKGDYIVKGIKGEFYPCKPDIFEESYEKVSE